MCDTSAVSSLHIPFVRRVAARDPDETHRVSTPLELFFDLVFVVAIAAAGTQLHHALSEGHAESTLNFIMTFLTIWWAWMNYSWYASAYDTNDIIFRLLTFVIMTGALIFAASVPDFYVDGQSLGGVIGYVIMRVGMVGLWLRAANGHPERRATALWYAGGITIAQIFWVARLAFPAEWLLPSFLAFFAFELLVPVLAERRGRTPYHPHHMAERYSLFTIIVLGEEILGVVGAVQGAFTIGFPVDLDLLLAGCLLMVFSAWWWYFCGDASPLVSGRFSAWLFGYGHLVVFASLAAAGSAVTAAVDLELGTAHAGTRLIALTLASCLALYTVSTTLLHFAATRDQLALIIALTFVAAVFVIAATATQIGTAIFFMGLTMVAGLALQMWRTNRCATG